MFTLAQCCGILLNVVKAYTGISTYCWKQHIFTDQEHTHEAVIIIS